MLVSLVWFNGQVSFASSKHSWHGWFVGFTYFLIGKCGLEVLGTPIIYWYLLKLVHPQLLWLSTTIGLHLNVLEDISYFALDWILPLESILQLKVCVSLNMLVLFNAWSDAEA